MYGGVFKSCDESHNCIRCITLEKTKIHCAESDGLHFLIRISQDLAKDLAMLAREIHDVAGEIDSVSPAAADSGALVESAHYKTPKCYCIYTV